MKMTVKLPEWLRKEIKAIVVEALREWENEVEYLGRPGYTWNPQLREWEPDDKETKD